MQRQKANTNTNFQRQSKRALTFNLSVLNETVSSLLGLSYENICITHVFGVNGKSSVWSTSKYLCVVGKPLNITALWLFLLCKAAYKTVKKGI